MQTGKKSNRPYKTGNAVIFYHCFLKLLFSAFLIF